MISGDTIKVLMKQVPNYHEIRVGKGFLRNTVSLIPCKDCRYCVTTGADEGDIAARVQRVCSRVLGLVNPACAIVGEFCTCDKAQHKPPENYGELFGDDIF